MDNPPEFSPSEPLNHETTPSGLEWGAIALGFLVGMMWWVVQQLFWAFLFNYIAVQHGIRAFSSTPFVTFSLVMRFASPLAYGTIVGFVVGYHARHQAYRSTFFTMIAIFLVTSGWSLAINAWAVGFSLDMLQTVFFSLLALGAAFNGTYLAQSVKRNRGVRIH